MELFEDVGVAVIAAKLFVYSFFFEKTFTKKYIRLTIDFECYYQSLRHFLK